MRSTAKRAQGNLLVRSWWVFLILALSVGVYSHAMQKKKVAISSLQTHFNTLLEEKLALQNVKEDLSLQINSQSDPAWVELTLMKVLGLVPEGQVKVFFQNDDDSSP